MSLAVECFMHWCDKNFDGTTVLEDCEVFLREAKDGKNFRNPPTEAEDELQFIANLMTPLELCCWVNEYIA